MADIKVRDLTDTQTINTDDEIMVLTNAAQNQVQNITVGNFITNVISSDSDNVIEQGTDGKLYVETPENITGELSDLDTVNKTSLVNSINEVVSNLSTEATTRANADNNLQSQIDAITAASDVTDIVGTYAQLQAYDTTGLANNSIIKVLQDESRQDETTYYRWVITGGIGAWVLIGEEGPYYTISQADSKFATQATVGDLSNLATSDKSSVVNAMNELASVLDPTQTADYIKNSKAIYSGEVSENATILPQIKEMAHSTFARSKFQIAGSPNITDDGIASGFSTNDYLTFSSQNLTYQNDWEVVSPEFEVGATNLEQAILVIGDDNSRLIIQLKNNGKFLITTQIPLTASSILRVDNVAYSANTKYQVKVTHTSAGVYTAYLKTGNGDFTQIGSPVTNATAQFDTTGLPCRIGLHTDNSGAVTNGSIDLKQFSITVDGVEVFSGNKTGIDTIKPDDYTVVGTPTISADGVASGFNSGNYLTWSSNLTSNTNKVSVEMTVTPYNFSHTLYSVFFRTTGAEHPLCFYRSGYNTTARISMYFRGDPGWIDSGTLYSVNDTVDVKYEFIDGTLTLYSKLHGANNWTTEMSKQTSNFFYGDFYFGRNSSEAIEYLNGSIDLNSVKVYVDGDLVYQPCLKIPYTESFTGSKIAQAVYRDRVKDAYEQGYHQFSYYTLDEENGNFTLPQGEIYGMIGVNRNRITELESNKLDKDGSNATNLSEAFLTQLMPDYSSGISISSFPYTAPANGFIDVGLAAVGQTAQLYVNNIKVGHAYASNNTFYAMISGQYRVKTGDVITLTGGNFQYAEFFPYV